MTKQTGQVHVIDMDAPFFSVRDVSRILHVTELTVRGWIKDNKLKAGKFGKSWRIANADLKSFITERMGTPNADD